MENKEVTDIKSYHKNPRKITGKMFDLLRESMQEFGDLSGVVVNTRTGEAIGGNQRTTMFKENPDECIMEVQALDKPTSQGTVAYGTITYKGERFSYREVDWDDDKVERANILANKVGGFWDNDILANQFDIETLRMGGFEDFELGFANEEVKIDTDDLTKTMDSYLEGNIKQMVFFFESKEFDELTERMKKIRETMGVENNTEAFLKLVEEHERNQD